MPAVSKAQFHKLGMLRSQGKISKKVADEFLKGVDFKSLPDRVKKKTKPWRRKTAK